MGSLRTFSNHVRWTEAEVSVIEECYADGDWGFILSHLPGRSKSQVQNKAYGLGIVRAKPPKMTADERRKRKRESMARRRASNPEGAREYQRGFYHKNREQQLAYQKQLREKRFFWNRANRLRGKSRADYKSLAALWKSQRGLCALSGAKLTRENAELDHKLPKSRGGKDMIENLQWVTFDVNRAKRSLTDAEFTSLCCAVMEWIGERIQRMAK